MHQDPYVPLTANVDDIASSTAAPVLWNPRAALGWSLVFTPIFGALVHMKNWQSLGEAQKAAECKTWAIISGSVSAASVLLTITFPNAAGLDLLLRLGGIALLIAWYFQNAKEQIALVTTRFGQDYQRRSWMTPILYALVATGAFFLIIFVAVGATGGS